MSVPLVSLHDAIAVIDGWPVNIADPTAAVRTILDAANRNDSFAVFTLNLDHLYKLRRSPSFREAYARARYITADGAPVARLASRPDMRVERTTGADLIVPLAAAAASAGVPVYLFGTSSEVLAKAAARLMADTDAALSIAGSEAPEVGFDPEGPEADAALDRIAASGARICFVALGAPKQELFAARAVARGIQVGFVCIGAGLDFLAGAQTRAPAFMQRTGSEWLWRLATNPRRLAGRYARCALVLFEIVLLSPFRQKIAGPRG